MTTNEYVFTAPDYVSAIDYAVKDDEGNWRSLFTGQTQEELNDTYPGVSVTTEKAFTEWQYAQLRTTPLEITQQAFNDALNAKPPMNRAQLPDSMSFMDSERITASVTRIFVSFNDEHGMRRYVVFSDRATLTHRQVLTYVQHAMAGGGDYA